MGLSIYIGEITLHAKVHLLFMAFSLIEAIKQGDIAGAVALLKTGKCLNVNAQGARSDGTALFWACWRGNIELVRLLLQRGADINARNCWNSTPLHAASDRNNIETVKYLLRQGANVDLQTLHGDTPCHLAAYRGFSNIVQLLIENGASIFVINSSRRTCLDEACLSGNTNLVTYIEAVYNIIVRNGAEVESENVKEPHEARECNSDENPALLCSINNLSVCSPELSTSLINDLSLETSSNVSNNVHWNIREFT